MVGSKRIVSVTLLLPVILTGCSFFQMSPYAASIAYIQQQKSLAGVALPSTSTYGTLECETDGTHEVVYLLQYGSASGTHLVICDSNLNTMYSGFSLQYGRFHLVEQSGKFVIGTTEFDPTLAAPVPAPITFGGGNQYSPDSLGFYDGSSNYVALSVNSVTSPASSTLNAAFYPAPGWYTPSSYSYQLSSTTALNNISHLTVDTAHNLVSAVVSDSTTSYIIQFAPTQSGLAALTQPILTSSAMVYQQSGSNAPELFPISGGVIYVSNNQLTYEPVPSSGTTTGITLPDKSGSYMVAANPDGTHIYVYDRNTDKLYRYGAWW